MTRSIDAGTIRRLSLALALLVLLPLPALAATIHVDGDCPLELAIKSANEGVSAPYPTPTMSSGVTITPTAAPSGCEAGDAGADTIVLTRDVREVVSAPITYKVTSEIFIDARGHAFVGVGDSGAPEGNGFIFEVGSDKLTIDNARFTNASDASNPFGEVRVIARGNGEKIFQNVEFYNSAEDTDGTGVYLKVEGTAKIREGVFKDNRLSATKSVVSGSVDIYRSTFHNNHGSGSGYVISSAAQIRSSTIGLNRGSGEGSFAVSGGRLNNVTVAHNRGGGVSTSGKIRNSILYENTGPDCATSTAVEHSWIGDTDSDSPCSGTEVRTGPSPDIDDDFEFGLFTLEADGDAVGLGRGCEFLDQWGRPFGPDPCDLGAHSTYRPGSGPRISAPAPTPLPTPTRVPDQPAPTIEPVQGWVLFSDRDDIKSNEVNAAGVGIAHIVEMGFLEAVDIWSEVGWGVTVCHTDYSNGNFVFLDAAGMPREAVTWPAAPHIDGMACTYIETPGTVVLLRADPWQEPATPTPDPNAPVFGPPTPFMLEDCQLITRDMVNLRAEAWGDVLNIIPYETELTASEASEEFFKVTFEEQEGWVHRDWVTITAGVCGEVEDEEA